MNFFNKRKNKIIAYVMTPVLLLYMNPSNVKIEMFIYVIILLCIGTFFLYKNRRNSTIDWPSIFYLVVILLIYIIIWKKELHLAIEKLISFV